MEIGKCVCTNEWHLENSWVLQAKELRWWWSSSLAFEEWTKSHIGKLTCLRSERAQMNFPTRRSCPHGENPPGALQNVAIFHQTCQGTSDTVGTSAFQQRSLQLTIPGLLEVSGARLNTQRFTLLKICSQQHKLAFTRKSVSSDSSLLRHSNILTVNYVHAQAWSAGNHMAQPVAQLWKTLSNSNGTRATYVILNFLAATLVK